MGYLVDRVHRMLKEEEINEIACAYHAWRGGQAAGEYVDKPGFCKSATMEGIEQRGYVLTPGRYVGAEMVEDDGEPFEEKIPRLLSSLREQVKHGQLLDQQIELNFRSIGLQ